VTPSAERFGGTIESCPAKTACTPSNAAFLLPGLLLGKRPCSPRGPGPFVDTLLFDLLLGLPVAFCASAVLAAPLYIWMRNRNRLEPKTILPAAAVVGLVTAVAIPLVFGLGFRGLDALPEILRDGRSLLIGGFLGGTSDLVGGAVFALIGTPFEPPRRAS
jgi:hypothetical protein